MSEFPPSVEQPVSKKEYIKFARDYSPAGICGRIMVFKGTNAGNILDDSLNRGSLDWEIIENNLTAGEFSEAEREELAEMMSAMILALDTNNTPGARVEAEKFKTLAKEVIERLPPR